MQGRPPQSTARRLAWPAAGWVGGGGRVVTEGWPPLAQLMLTNSIPFRTLNTVLLQMTYRKYREVEEGEAPHLGVMGSKQSHQGAEGWKAVPFRGSEKAKTPLIF